MTSIGTPIIGPPSQDSMTIKVDKDPPTQTRLFAPHRLSVDLASSARAGILVILFSQATRAQQSNGRLGRVTQHRPSLVTQVRDRVLVEPRPALVLQKRLVERQGIRRKNLQIATISPQPTPRTHNPIANIQICLNASHRMLPAQTSQWQKLHHTGTLYSVGKTVVLEATVTQTTAV